MAQIPDPGAPPSVVPDAMSDATIRVGVDPSMFGAGVAQSLSGMANTIGRSSDQLAGIAEQQEGMINNRAVTAAQNNQITQQNNVLYGDPNKPGDVGFMGLKGQAAVDALPGVVKQIQGIHQSLAGTMTNPVQQQGFADRAAFNSDRALRVVQDHGMQQQNDLAVSTAQDAQELLHVNAARDWNAPDRLNADLLQSQQNAAGFARNQGYNPVQTEAFLLADRTRLFQNVIRTAAASDPLRANSILTSVGGQIDPVAAANLKTELQPKLDEAQAQGAAGAALHSAAGGSLSIPTGTSSDGVWNGIVQTESGGRQFGPNGQPLTSGVGGADAPIGASQIKPSTARQAAAWAGITYDDSRLRTDQAYNEALGRAAFDQLSERYNGNSTLAAAAYNAGPGNVDAWLKAYGDPRNGSISNEDFTKAIPYTETRNYVGKVAALSSGTSSLPVASGQPGASSDGVYRAPDLNAMKSSVIATTPDGPVRLKALSLVTSAYSQWTAQTAAQRDALNGQLHDLNAEYMAGNTSTAIPENQIRGLLPPDQAEATIADLGIKRMAGIAFSAARWATPDEEQNTLAALKDPDSATGNAVRASGKTLVGQGAVPGGTGLPGGPAAPGSGSLPMAATDDGSPAPAPGSPAYVAARSDDAYALRGKIAAAYETMINTKHRALQDDPAGYVAASPAVLAAAKAVDPTDPATYQNYLATVKSVQQQLGVASPRLLTNDQVATVTQKLTTMDPNTGDVGAVLDGMAKEYGNQWPQVFGELVSRGKLPGEYQVLAAMDTYGQLPARADLQRALQVGGVDKLKLAAGGTAVRDIDGSSGNSPLDDALAPFRMTTTNNTGGLALYGNVRSAAQQLAYYYAGRGQDPQQAVNTAVAGVVGDKYDFSGTMRVPKGMLPAVTTAATSVMGNLTADDLAPANGPDYLPQGYKNGVMLGAAKSGSWVPNADDTGLVLMGNLRNGGVIPIKGKDGAPITVRFSDVAAGKYPPPPIPPPQGSPFMTAGQY